MKSIEEQKMEELLEKIPARIVALFHDFTASSEEKLIDKYAKFATEYNNFILLFEEREQPQKVAEIKDKLEEIKSTITIGDAEFQALDEYMVNVWHELHRIDEMTSTGEKVEKDIHDQLREEQILFFSIHPDMNTLTEKIGDKIRTLHTCIDWALNAEIDLKPLVATLERASKTLKDIQQVMPSVSKIINSLERHSKELGDICS